MGSWLNVRTVCITLALALGGCAADPLAQADQPVTGRYTSCAYPFGPCLRLDLRPDSTFQVWEYYQNPNPSSLPILGTFGVCGTWHRAETGRLRVALPAASKVTATVPGSCPDSLHLSVVGDCGRRLPGFMVYAGDTTLHSASHDSDWTAVPKREGMEVGYPSHAPINLDPLMQGVCKAEIRMAHVEETRSLIGTTWSLHDGTVRVPSDGSRESWPEPWPLRRVGPPVE